LFILISGILSYFKNLSYLFDLGKGEFILSNALAAPKAVGPLLIDKLLLMNPDNFTCSLKSSTNLIDLNYFM
jgi:hypothetical protein